MHTRVDFINVRRDEKLIEFVEKRSRALIRRLSKHASDEAAELHLRLIGSAYDKEGLLKEVEAEVLVMLPYRKSIVIRKKGRQFNHAIVEALTGVERILERDSEKKNSDRKRKGLAQKGRSVR